MKNVVLIQHWLKVLVDEKVEKNKDQMECSIEEVLNSLNKGFPDQ
jgi:hypothetical protein